MNLSLDELKDSLIQALKNLPEEFWPNKTQFYSSYPVFSKLNESQKTKVKVRLINFNILKLNYKIIIELYSFTI